MKPLILLFLILLGYSQLPAQDSTIAIIKAGYKVTDVLTPADIYFYPQFTDGKVIFKDGKVIEAKMNYNRVFDQMLFIDTKSDTLAMSVEKTVKFIAFDKDTFYYSNGFIRVIVDNDFVKLAEKQVWVVADIRKMGTHNRPSTTFAITSLTSYTNGMDAAKSKDLVLNEEIVLRKETEYYFGNAYSHFARAGKKKLQELFPNDEHSIESYLKENKVNFDKKNDLEKLAQFIIQLY
jgi:hypothetical protein